MAASSPRRWVCVLCLAACSAAVFSFMACRPSSKTSVVTAPGAPPTTRAPAGPTVPAGPDMFEDVTPKTGIKFMYRNGEESAHMAILESLGGGGALIDYDGDGLLDFFVPGGGRFAISAAEYKTRRDVYETTKSRLIAEAQAGKDDAVRAKKFEEAAQLRPQDPPQIHGLPGKLFRNKGNFEFEDVTKAAGLAKMPDLFTHGAAVGDYDRDGWPDLLVTGYGRVVLYHNEQKPDGKRQFVDVTEKSGLLGPNPAQRSEESGQPGPHFWSTSAAWGDLDGDGYPELYICQYVNWSFIKNHPVCPPYADTVVHKGKTIKVERDVCPPKQHQSRPHALWRNNGNGTFTNVTKEAGLRATLDEKKEREDQKDQDLGKGLGVLFVDVDDDRRPDIYVCNDTTDNFLYVNRSTPGKLQFEDKGLPLGVARDHNGTSNGSMGVDACDYDGAGRPSIWVTNYENEYHALYRSQILEGRLSFTYNTPAAGLTVLGPNFVGFGTRMLDVDNDGWEDIVISNGHVVYYPPRNNLEQQPLLFMNMPHQTKAGPTRRFANGVDRGGPYFKGAYRGRGLAGGDLDNDGRPDLVFIPLNEPVSVLRNVAGQGHHWLGVELAGVNNASVVGAKLTLQVGDRTLVRFIKGGGSYMSAQDMRVTFGLGAEAKVGKLRVDWPSGEPRFQEWDGLAAGQYHKLTQGK